MEKKQTDVVDEEMMCLMKVVTGFARDVDEVSWLRKLKKKLRGI